MKKDVKKKKFLNYCIDKFVCNLQRNPSKEYVSFYQIQKRAIHATDIYFNCLSAGCQPHNALEKSFAILFDGYVTDEFSYFG